MDRDDMIRRLPAVFQQLQKELENDPDWDMETVDWAIRHVFEDLEEMGYTRETPYNAETRAERDARLAAIGWGVARGPVG